MLFSAQLLSKAIESSSGELAWKKDDVFQAISELSKNNFAILGGDVWAIMKKQNDSKDLVLAQIDYENIAVGIIKGKDGVDYVFNWYSNKDKNESWNEYVERSKAETIDSINKLNAEETVPQELSNSIYYNLVFANENQYEKLKG